jgi:NitT/TauT family transport system ATP-binding protein
VSFLRVEKLCLDYGETRVLERVDLTVTEGSFNTIVGASGCGKSSFLRLLLGQEWPTAGAIVFDGKPLPKEPMPDRGIVYQRYSVYPHLTALQNLMLAAEFAGARLTGKLTGAARADARDQARTWLDRVGLAASADRYPAQLSGGMQQRLAIAQSLMARPRVLLMDEPFGALDPGIRGDMHALILDLWSETKMTVFMVTHDIQEAFRLGTRLLVFDKRRHDPQHPQAYGATIVYDLPIDRTKTRKTQET